MDSYTFTLANIVCLDYTTRLIVQSGTAGIDLHRFTSLFSLPSRAA